MSVYQKKKKKQEKSECATHLTPHKTEKCDKDYSTNEAFNSFCT